jgi:PAS domain S-box-containing protein
VAQADSITDWITAASSSELYRLVAQQFPGGSLALFDRDLRFQLVDGALLRAHTDPAAFEGKLVAEALSPEVAAQVVPLYHQALDGATRTATVSWGGHPYAVTVAPLRSDEGVIIGGISVNLDAGNLEQALTAAMHAQQRYRELFNGLRDPALIVDAERKILDVNPAFVALTGYGRAESVGRTTEFLYHDRADYDQYGASLHGEALAPSASQFVRKDGTRFTGEYNGSVLTHDGKADPIGYVHVITDVTERERARAELEESRIAREELLAAMLHAEDEQRMRLATDLHDDAIQEMAASILSIDMLCSDLRKSGNDELLQKAQRARDRLGGATERARRLMFELHPQLLEARGLAAALKQISDQLVQDTGIAATVHCPEIRFNPAAESLAYRTVLEALANVRRHAEAAHVSITITPGEQSLHGSVRDDGIGFDTEAVRRRPTDHLHLGLAAMRERVSLAGGSIVVESALGSGTTVTFAVPNRDTPS